jgi:hypothetical protein
MYTNIIIKKKTITGSGNNILKLNLDDLLHASTSTNILKVLGNSAPLPAAMSDKLMASVSCLPNTT